MPPTLQQSYDKAASKLREWFNRRLETQSLDIARLYRVDRDRFIFRLRTIFEQYLQADPTFVRAKITGATQAIEQAIDSHVRSLAKELDSKAVENLKDLMGTHSQAVRTFLKDELAGIQFQHLPYPTQNVLNELTTGVMGGGTFFDHMFHVTDGLKAKISSTIRGALVQGPERDSKGNIKGDWFGDMRAKLLKDFGVDKLAEPKGPAYSSVKVYKNEARRQWNLLQRELARRSGSSLMWYAELDERSSPGCVARHGMLADELDDYPPRHFNCRCQLIPIQSGSDTRFYVAQAAAWLQENGYTRRQAQTMEAAFPWGSALLIPAMLVERNYQRVPKGSARGGEFTGKDRDECGAIHGDDENKEKYRCDRPSGHKNDHRKTPRESSVPRLALPLVATGMKPPRVENYPDAVVMRTVNNTREVRTTEGWQPLKGKGKWCETQQGFFLDSPDIGPTWTPRKRRLTLDLINRWPKMRNITWAGLGPQEVYAVKIMNQTEANAAALGIMPEQEWISGEDLGDLVKQHLATGVLSMSPHPHLAVAIVPVARQLRSSRPELSTPVIKAEPDDVRNIVSLADGAAIYARDNFDGGLLAPYQRCAVICFEPDGNVWAIRPRGRFFWALPGGHIEKDELPQDAARREMEEETGVKCTIVGHLGVLYRPWSTTQMFLARRDEPAGSPLLPEEIDAAASIPLENLDAAEQSWIERRWGNIEAARVFVTDRNLFEAAFVEDAFFDASKHPRGYHGKFTPSGSRKVSPEIAKHITARRPSPVSIVSVNRQPEYTGEAKTVRTQFASKKEGGDIGEAVVAAYIQQTDPGAHLVEPIGKWKAVDGISRNEAFDVKTGLISVGQMGNRHWRFTFDTKDSELEALAGKSADFKAKYNEQKMRDAVARKIDAARDVAAVLGRSISPAVWGVILNPDNQRADLYHIPGWHTRTAWGDVDAMRPYYVGTVKYKLPAGKKRSLAEAALIVPPTKRITWDMVPDWALVSMRNAGILDEATPRIVYEYARSIDSMYWDTFSLLMQEFGDNNHGH